MLKLLLGLLLAALFAVPLGGCARAVLVPEPTGEISVAFLGDKAEDAILLYGDDFAVLIDTGLNKTGQEIVEYIRSKGIAKLDLMLITHYDKDHVGGADSVLESVPVSRVLGADYESDSKQYEQFAKAAQKAGLAIERVSADTVLQLGRLSLQIDAPSVFHEQENDRSLVVRAQYGDCTLLFAGDAEKDRIAELLGGGVEKCTLLKVPHHGRIEDNSALFFDALRPQLAVITSHEEEMEDPAVVGLLENAGAQVFLTRLGLVEGSCDGHVVKLTQRFY